MNIKALIVILFSICSINAIAQGWQWEMRTNKVDMRILEERVQLEKQYLIRREGQFVHIEMLTPNGSIGWACKIIDSTQKGIYVLDYHWITTFDSLEVKKESVRLFNHTLDQVIWSK